MYGDRNGGEGGAHEYNFAKLKREKTVLEIKAEGLQIHRDT